MHYLYILYSNTIQKYYVGESTNPFSRLELHNQHYFKKNFTKAASDWKIVLNQPLNTKADALYVERFIKRMKSKIFISKVIKSPTIIEDILSKRNK